MKIKSIKFWINAITLLALGLLIFFARDQIAEAFRTILTLNMAWLLLIIPIQVGNYVSVGKFYQTYLRTMGENLKFSSLFKIGLEMNFVNNVFPSGGVSGFGYLSMRLKRLGVPGSKTTLLQTSRYILTFLTFIIYLIIALFLLSIFGSAGRFLIFVATLLSSGIITLTAVLLYIISDEKRITSFMSFLPKAINRVFRRFHRESKNLIDIQKVDTLFHDLHKDYVHVVAHWRDLRYPFLWTMMMTFTEISTIFVVYLAFGELVNPGAIIISYAVANIAGLVSILPGGIGIYEGLMTGVMTSAGVERGLALSATVVYRVLNMALFLPIGYVLYHKALRSGSEPKSKSVNK